jgi:hypothetical protein
MSDPYELAKRDALRCNGEVHTWLPIVLEQRTRKGFGNEIITVYNLRFHMRDERIYHQTVEIWPEHMERHRKDILISAIDALVSNAAFRKEDGTRSAFEELFTQPAKGFGR